MIRGTNRWVLLAVTLAVALAPEKTLSQETICEGFEGSQRVLRFGGNAVSDERADTLDDLRRLFAEHRAEFASVMERRGLGHLMDDLSAAIASGEGVSQRNINRGETFEWMAARRNGEVGAGGPVCMAATQTYEAFEIKISEESVEPAKAQCSLRASSDCQAGTLTVDASGSSSGVRVTMTGGGGSMSLLSGGAQSWSGPFEDRYVTDYSFAATASATGSRTVTTHTFLIPKICLNLSYSGDPTVIEEALTDSCSATAQVERCAATPASCSIDRPAAARSGKTIQVGASGHWDSANPNGLVVSVTGPDGSAFARLGGVPAALTLGRPGTYVFNATATNEAGETATCSAELVADPRLTLRGFGVRISPDDTDVIEASGAIAGPIFNAANSYVRLGLEPALGFGGDVEYHLNPRVGLMASLIIATVDAELMYDTALVWEMGSSEFDYNSFTFGPNFHLTPRRRVDFYIGPFVGVANMRSAQIGVPSRSFAINLGKESIFGGLLGLDIPFGQQRIWGLHLGSRYMEYSSDRSGRDIDVNPLLFEAGIARTF